MSPLKVFFVCALVVMATAIPQNKNVVKKIKQKVEELKEGDIITEIILQYLKEHAFPPVPQIGRKIVTSVEHHSGLLEGMSEIYIVADFTGVSYSLSPDYSPFPCQAIIYISTEGPVINNITDLFIFDNQQDMKCINRRVPPALLC